MKIPKIEYNKLGKEKVHVSFSEECFKTLGVTPSNVVVDDKIHRFGHEGRCWYVLHESKRGTGTKYGFYGDWSSLTNKELHFCSSQEGLTSLEKRDEEESRRKLEEEKKRIQGEITKEMRAYYNKLPEADTHPYLKKKGVKASKDLRLDGDTLIIPLYNSTGEIQTLQKITPKGEKKLYYGLSSSSVRYIFQGNSRIFLCEGYATGASIHEATGATVVCAMFAGNLPKIAPEYKGAVIVADNDKSETGENAAKSCEGCDYILIPDEGMDANDYAYKYGNEALNALLVPPKKDRYFISLAEMMEKPTFPPYLIKGMFSRGQLGMMIGASGAGKSHCLLDMMLTLAFGLGTWHGKKCKKANVIYLCGEGYEGVKIRIRGWLLEHGLNINDGNFYATEYAKDLTNSQDLADIIEELDGIKEAWGSIDFIVVDTYNQFNSGDENAADSAHAFLANITRIRLRFACCFMLAHHTALSVEGQRRARGSSVIHGAMDFVFLVEKDPDNDNLFSLTTIKQKDIEPAQPMGFEMKQISIDWKDEDGEPYTSVILIDRDMKKPDLKLAPCFEIYSFFKDWWIGREGHFYSENEGWWTVPRADMEEFVMLWKKVKNGKEMTREGARRNLGADKEVGRLMGRKMKKLDTKYYLVKIPQLTLAGAGRPE